MQHERSVEKQQDTEKNVEKNRGVCYNNNVKMENVRKLQFRNVTGFSLVFELRRVFISPFVTVFAAVPRKRTG